MVYQVEAELQGAALVTDVGDSRKRSGGREAVVDGSEARVDSPDVILSSSAALRALSMLLTEQDLLDLPSAWTEHIPFAYWLIEAHRPAQLVELGTYFGASYFAFCQAVATLGLPTRCFAVDTWRGDEHSGLYEDHV